MIYHRYWATYIYGFEISETILLNGRTLLTQKVPPRMFTKILVSPCESEIYSSIATSILNNSQHISNKPTITTFELSQSPSSILPFCVTSSKRTNPSEIIHLDYASGTQLPRRGRDSYIPELLPQQANKQNTTTTTSNTATIEHSFSEGTQPHGNFHRSCRLDSRDIPTAAFVRTEEATGMTHEIGRGFEDSRPN